MQQTKWTHYSNGVKQLDEYEKKADDWNAWLDGRMGTLESIGGVSAKFDVEMEMQKLQVRKNYFSVDV